MQLRARPRRAPRADRPTTTIENPVDYVAGLGIQYSWVARPRAASSTRTATASTTTWTSAPARPPAPPWTPSGCPLPQDDDGDGVTNDIDKCPGTPAGAKVDASGCELDSDGDGVGDSRDQCPNTPAGAKVDEQGCELDGDGDGVVDSQDKCPDTPKGDRVDAVGCSFKEEIKLPGVMFETNKRRPAAREPSGARVTPSPRLKRYPEVNVEVAGSYGQPRIRCASTSTCRRDARHRFSSTCRDGGVSNTHHLARLRRAPSRWRATTPDEGRQQNRRVICGLN